MADLSSPIPSTSLPFPPQTWNPLSTAGHSTVFTVPTTPPQVLKLFRLNFPQDYKSNDPYLFYHNELRAYERLTTSTETRELKISRFCASFELTAEHEVFLAEKSLIPKLHILKARREWRKKAEDMPLMGILMDLVPGRRLEKQDLRENVAVTGESRKVGLVVGQGLAEMHRRGVRHGDVKWRNVLITEDSGEEGRSVVWIDFSNSVVRRDEEDEEWERLCHEEMKALNKMLG